MPEQQSRTPEPAPDQEPPTPPRKPSLADALAAIDELKGMEAIARRAAARTTPPDDQQ